MYVKLNNGERERFGDTTRSMQSVLMRIMDECRDELGHMPSLEEALNYPKMPRIEYIERAFGTYELAIDRREYLDKVKKGWRRRTEEEASELEALEKTKRANEGVSEIFQRKPYSLAKEGTKAKIRQEEELRSATEVVKKVECVKKTPKKRIISARKLQKEDVISLIREFSDENRRFPKADEVYKLHYEEGSKWPTMRTLYNLLGKKSDWPKQIYPEGLPGGFIVDGRVSR